MLKKMVFLSLAATAFAVNAGAEAVTPSQDANGCYLIGNADELDGFTQNVVGTAQSVCSSIVEEEGGAYPLGTVLYEDCDNRSNVVGTSKIFEGCVKLTADVNYQGENALLKSDTTLSLDNPRQWSPIMYFAGSFDGDGHTIKGLYAKQDWEPSLIRHAVSGATIKNVNLVDSYFYATSGGAGSIVGNMEVYEPLKEKPVTIDKCSFKGFLYGKDNSGGLVGSMNANARLSVTNSFTEAKFSGDGANVAGLVGYVADKSIVSIVNCYSNYIGTTKQNPLVGSKKGSGVTINAENVGCAYKPRSGLSPSTESRCYAVITDRNATYRATTLSDLQTNYQNNLGKIDTETKSYDAATIENMIGDKIEGVTFNDVQDANGNWITVAVTLSEGDSVTVPQKIKVGGVIVDRAFKTGVNSTLILPFSIAANKVDNAKFFNVTAMAENEGVWTVTGEQEVATIAAHTPYLVKPTAENVVFNGEVTLVPTEHMMYSVEVENAADWSFRGLYKTKLWEEGDEELGTVGQVYGYSSKADAERGIEQGSFVRAGKNVRVKPMRGYLYYAVPRCQGLCKAAAVSLEDLPSTIVVELIEKEMPPYVEEVVETLTPSEGDESDEGVESPLSITKPVMAPSAAKADRWFDLGGRRLNKKPSSHGVFFNNETPVIVK